MTENDLRIMLLKQRALFGTTQELAFALGMSEQNLHRFLSGKQGLRFRKVLAALDIEHATIRVLKPKTEI